MFTETMDFMRLALLLGAMAYQLDLITTAQYTGFLPTSSSNGQAVEAFITIAFLTFAAGFVILIELNFCELKGNKIAVIIAIICLLVAGKQLVLHHYSYMQFATCFICAYGNIRPRVTDKRLEMKDGCRQTIDQKSGY
jgi:hypothetical protein